MSVNPVAIVRVVLAAFTVVFGISAFFLSDTIHRTQSTVEQIKSHELAWATANARIEFAKLGQVAAAFVLTGAEEDRHELETAFAIVEGRMKILREGKHSDFARTSPARLKRFADLTAQIEHLAAVVAQLPSEAAWLEFRERTRTTGQLITRIATDTQAVGLEDARNLRKNLEEKQAIQNLLLAGLVLSVGSLLAISEYQNHLLSRARIAAEEARKQFQYLARHDALTKLPNRAAFSEALHQAHVQQLPGRLALFVIDLDGFKPINDTLGHGVGDVILCSVAERLQNLVPQGRDMVSRFGGDEFVVLLHGVRDAGEALDRARALASAIREPHVFDGHALVIDASIGVAISEAGDIDELIHRADIALNKAKGAGRAQITFFRPEMLEEVEQHSRVERDLAVALREGDIFPVYQPQFDVTTGKMTAVEALARWSHPIYGSIPPSDFIPVAEASGQIAELGVAILLRACCDAVERFPQHVSVAVNVSAAQVVQDDFPLTVINALATSGLPARRLVLEITKSAMMKDAVRAERTVDRLRALGITLSLDDFGTGHSSLSYLRRFRLDELKIDRSFVTNLETSAEDVAIVRTIIRLARTLNLKVVAEGVETHGQLEKLRSLGCTHVQGYLLGKPVRASALFPVTVEVETRLAS